MSISYNGGGISEIKYNPTVINSVTYNGTVVFPGLVDYTFPNANAKMTAVSCLGINTYKDCWNSATYGQHKAFDTDLATAYVATYAPSSQDTGRFTIVFPFDIYLQSVTITNASKNPCNSTSSIGGLKTGYIYISPDTATSNFSISSTDGYTVYNFATLSRDNPTTASYATTHTNETYANTAIRSICIRGTTWGSNNWHIIGEVALNFKVASSDLSSWKSTYGIS